jgi:hypothetical protein
MHLATAFSNVRRAITSVCTAGFLPNFHDRTRRRIRFLLPRSVLGEASSEGAGRNDRSGMPGGSGSDESDAGENASSTACIDEDAPLEAGGCPWLTPAWPVLEPNSSAATGPTLGCGRTGLTGGQAAAASSGTGATSYWDEAPDPRGARSASRPADPEGKS